jgi:hypothetical protein
LSDREQLVDECSPDDEECTQEPNSECQTGSRGIIGVVDDGTNFGVGGVLRDKDSFEFHFMNDLRVFVGWREDVGVVEEIFHLREDTGGEVLIVFVESIHWCDDLWAWVRLKEAKERTTGEGGVRSA